VVDGIGDIARFRARRPRMLDHRLQHLCRGDDGTAVPVRESDDSFLCAWYGLEWQLDAKITTCNHHCVAGANNRFDVVKGHIFFDLRYDKQPIRNELAKRLDVFGAPDETEREIIDLLFYCEPNVGRILFGD